MSCSKSIVASCQISRCSGKRIAEAAKVSFIAVFIDRTHEEMSVKMLRSIKEDLVTRHGDQRAEDILPDRQLEVKHRLPRL